MSTFGVLNLLLGVAFAGYSKTCNPMDYGAKGDGKNDDTSAIQKAMDECYNNDAKGLVSLPSGKKFLSFPLSTSKVSNIGFEIEGELIINNDRDKWPKNEDFLCFNDVTNLEIFGDGKINGQGQVWWQHTDDFRPKTIKMEGCDHVKIKDITVEYCPDHCLELYANHCEVDSIRIQGNPIDSENTDGIDVHGSPFHIHDSYISTGDDNVAVHANDTLVENCHFGTGHGASIGSLGGGWYRNITFNNIQFNGTTNGARIKTHPGATAGKVSDVYYTNLKMKDVENAIIITQFYDGGEEKSELIIDNVKFESITSSGGKNAGQFMCQDSTPCHNIELKDVQISAENGFECSEAYGTSSDTKPDSCLKS